MTLDVKEVIPGVVNDEYAVFESLKGYELYPEYPCYITSADSFELRYYHFIIMDRLMREISHIFRL